MNLKPQSKRGVAGVFAAVIFFAILFTAGMTFIIYTFQTQNSQNQASASANQKAQEQASETLLMRSCDNSLNPLPNVNPYYAATCPPTGGTPSHTGVFIQNTGSVAVTLVGIWINGTVSGSKVTVESPTTSPSPSTYPVFSQASPFTLNPGMSKVFDIGYALSSASTSVYTITVISESGNKFSAIYPPPAIGNVVPTITTSLSQSAIQPGGSVYDTSVLSGIRGSAAGDTVQYQWFNNGLCTGSGLLGSVTVTVSSTNTVPASSSVSGGTPTFPNAGSYSWDAIFSGDTNNAGATSSCELLTVGVAVTTTLNQASITVGGTDYDTATLTGGSANVGDVVYYYFSSSDTCPSTGATSAGIETVVTAGVIPNSNVMTFSTAGAYYWYATYVPVSGSSLTSPCELLIVQSSSSSSKASPTITTSLSASTVPAGPNPGVTDTATLSGGNSPTGIIVFAVYLGTTCSSSTLVSTSSPTVVSGAGAYTSSPSFSPSVVGSPAYSWIAEYTGDGNNNPYITSCSSEPLTVTKANPSIATQFPAGSTQVVGTGVSDSATLSADGDLLRHDDKHLPGIQSNHRGRSHR